MPVVAPCRLLAAVALSAGTLFGTTVAAADWYVTPSGKGGNGSKEKPFKGIVKALEKAASGDIIHVVQGEYTGKKKAGFLAIERPELTLVGGYKDKEFAERDPFAYPTVITEKGKPKGEAVAGGYIRPVLAGTRTDHRGTTIDGFWFDRKSHNRYDKKRNLIIGPQTNLTPMIDFRDQGCHVRNSVFLNSAAVAVRLAGDGSSVVNNLFVNINGAGVIIWSESERIAPDFNRIVVKNNTFVGLWNCCSLEGGAGAAVVLDAGVEAQVTDNIFHLSAGNQHSMGWAVRSEKNFGSNVLLHFARNSTSQLRGGILRYFDPELTAILFVTAPEGLAQASVVSSEDNDGTDPLFEHDEGWLAAYSSALPPDDASEQNIDVEELGKMRERHGLPTDGSDYAEGAGVAAAYSIAHVKTGALWKPAAEGIAARGVQASVGFEIVTSAMLAEGGTTAAGGEAESTSADGASAGSSSDDGEETAANKEGEESTEKDGDAEAKEGAATEGEATESGDSGEQSADASSEAGEESAENGDGEKSADGSDTADGTDDTADGASAEKEGDGSPDGDYEAIAWAKLWSKGESMVDTRIALTVYWTKWDTGFAAGRGKKAKPFLEGADRKSHKILALRQVPKTEGRALLKGFVAIGSPALDYVKKKAKKKCPPKGRCKFSFVVRGVIKKAGGKLGKKSPQIIIAIDQISEK